MKAIVYNAFGGPDQLHLKEIPTPVPKAGEILVQVSTVALNKADLILLSGDPFLARPMVGNFFRPKEDMVLGADLTGKVVAVGAEVKAFQVGDLVLSDLSNNGFGGLAQYVCSNADLWTLCPKDIDLSSAAAMPLAGVTALRAIQIVGGVKAGQKVLINGASGGVGTYALQIAKALGAEVTAVCSSRHVETVRRLGADHIIDYTKESLVNPNIQYDLIHAANGNLSIFEYGQMLKPQGTYVMSGGAFSQMLQAMALGPLLSRKKGKQYKSVSSKPDLVLLQHLMDLLNAGKVTPVIDSTYTLEQTPEAFKKLKEGKHLGKILIQVQEIEGDYHVL